MTTSFDWRDKPLFTPGPLTTSRGVKQAMLRDLGSRDDAFIRIVRDIRDRLVTLAGVTTATHTAVLMQGSGTFGLESVVTTAIPRDGKLLVAINGAYGRRMVQIARVAGIAVTDITFAEDQPVDPNAVAEALASDPAITHVTACHCETTSGIINPVEAIGAVVAAAQKHFILDAMSAFGAMPLNVETAHVTYLVSSANKCIEGVPGFSFVVAEKAALAATRGNARSLSLDLHAQHDGLDNNGQFRFTPPTHALLAFHEALTQLDAEGGPAGRLARYTANRHALLTGMRAMGFVEYLAESLQSPIISTFRYPTHPNFNFDNFYRRLSDAGYVIYPGKVGAADCFRIGTIGRLNPADMRDLIAAIARVLTDMHVQSGA